MSNNSSSRNPHMATTSSGWLTFAGYLMIVAGFFQSIAGLVAIFKPSLYVAAGNHLLVLDYTQWGWVHLITGIILLLAAGSLFTGRLWARIVAIMFATISAVLNFGFIWAYPIWSIMIVVLDVLVIYGVAMHGGGRSNRDGWQ